MLKIMNLHYETINHVNKWDCYKLGVVNSIFYLQLSNKIRSSFLTIYFFLCCMLRFLNHLVQWNSCNFPLILRQDSARGLALFKSVITSHFLFRRFLCWLVLIYLFIMFIVCSSRTCKGSSKFEWKVGDCWSNYQGWFAFFYCRFVGKLDITSF